MKPALEIGDIVLIRRIANKSEINAAPASDGDIIAFYVDDTLVVHRAIQIICQDDIWYFETKGDSNYSSDGWIPEQNAVGKVVAIIPKPSYTGF